MVIGKFRTLGAVVAAALAVAACGDKQDNTRPASQVAARVNTGEISVHQVNFALRRGPDVAPEQLDDTKRKVLDDLVDQELAFQAALEAKLDRNPGVMQSLEAARRDILARAWLEQRAEGVANPTQQEIGDYFKEHPELFTTRRIYHLQEATFPALPDLLAAARDQIARGRSAADILSLFRAQKIVVTGGTDMKPAERIDLKLLPRLAALKDGQTTLVEHDGNASVLTIIQSIVEPLGEETARPLIEQYLRRQKVEGFEREATRDLRQKAKIEYIGEFSEEAVANRKQKLAEAARKLQETQAAREAARQAQAMESARQVDAARQARITAEPVRTQAGRAGEPK